MKRMMLRALPLLMCLMLAMPAQADGLRFRLEADVEPTQYPEDIQPLLTGVDALMQGAVLDGTLIQQDGAFSWDATLHLGGQARAAADMQLFGLSSHWGVTSSLLGDTELMVNCASLLPFGVKAADWLGVPLDKVFLAIPYVHRHALAGAWELLSPLFPQEEGKRSFTRAELDELARRLIALCDEDPALNCWLEATGLYDEVTQYAAAFLDLPPLIVPGMKVTRTADTLRWDVLVVNIMTLRQEGDATTLTFTIPTKAKVNGTLREDGETLAGTLHAQAGDTLQLDLTCCLPKRLPTTQTNLYLTLDAIAPSLPAEGLHLVFNGDVEGDLMTVRLLNPYESTPMLTLTAEITSYEAPAIPAYTPADLDGFNILSVNGDSLGELMHEVKGPLVSGLIGIVAAAPAQAVQTLMDVMEDAGVIDLLADTLLGGSGY